jgi:Uma2 family endonuclease
MTYTPSRFLTFDEFLNQYGDNPRYELADGELIDMESTGHHEAVGGKLATKISVEIERQNLPWLIPRTCIVSPFANEATVRCPDVVILDETVLSNEPLWSREPVITLGRSIKLVLEVVSTNWGAIKSGGCRQAIA